jgi:gliding motility-associated-like protein
MTPQPTTILRTNIHFTDKSDGRIVNWQWNFAGMDTSLKRNPNYRFPDEARGNYPVRLDVTTDEGCVDDTIQVVRIDPEYYLYVPNSFSPNGDGKNDTWKPLGTGFDIDFYHVLVFDRWGNLVFETYDYDEYWDGTMLGTEEVAPVGVYTWKIVTGDSKDEKERHDRFGNVTIIK